MRLLVIGPRKGELAQATEMAARAGAKSVHAGDLDAGLDQLRRNGADLVLIDVTLSVPEFIAQVRSERILVDIVARSEEHTSELQSLMRHSYAVFCLKKKTTH